MLMRGACCMQPLQRIPMSLSLHLGRGGPTGADWARSWIRRAEKGAPCLRSPFSLRLGSWEFLLPCNRRRFCPGTPPHQSRPPCPHHLPSSRTFGAWCRRRQVVTFLPRTPLNWTRVRWLNRALPESPQVTGLALGPVMGPAKAFTVPVGLGTVPLELKTWNHRNVRGGVLGMGVLRGEILPLRCTPINYCRDLF